MSTGDIIVLVILAAVLALALAGIIRRRKKGNACCGECAGCIASNNCKKVKK